MIDDSYQELVKKVWREYVNLEMSHKLLEDDIKGWKHNTFDQVIVKKKDIMARLDGIHN